MLRSKYVAALANICGQHLRMRDPLTMSKKTQDGDAVVIKKYANRRLYDTSTSAYVTLDHLRDLVKEGVDFVVQDAKSGEDLTRSVLAQIIFEQESKGENMLPASFLRQLIQYYGDGLQAFVPSYLELSMNNFAKSQEQWRGYMKTAMDKQTSTPTSMMEDQIKRNMAMFEQGMRMWSMFNPAAPGGYTGMGAMGASAGAAAETIATMQNQMMEMQRQLMALSKGPGSKD